MDKVPFCPNAFAGKFMPLDLRSDQLPADPVKQGLAERSKNMQPKHTVTDVVRRLTCPSTPRSSPARVRSSGSGSAGNSLRGNEESREPIRSVLNVEFEVKLLTYLMEPRFESLMLPDEFFEDQKAWQAEFQEQQRQAEDRIHAVLSNARINIGELLPGGLSFASAYERQYGILYGLPKPARAVIFHDPLQLWNFSFPADLREKLLMLPHPYLDQLQVHSSLDLEVFLTTWLFGKDGVAFLLNSLSTGNAHLLSVMYLAKLLQVHELSERTKAYEDALRKRLCDRVLCWRNDRVGRAVYLPARLALYTILVSHLAFPDNYGHGDLLRERVGNSMLVVIDTLRRYGDLQQTTPKFWECLVHVVEHMEVYRYLMQQNEHQKNLALWIYHRHRLPLMNLPIPLLAYSKHMLSDILGRVQEGKGLHQRYSTMWFKWPGIFEGT